MIKIIIAILLAVAIVSMRVGENDPFRNRTIVRVLAAYSNKCIVFNQQAGEYEYIHQSFISCFREFIGAYLSIPFTPDKSQGKLVQQAFDRHRREVGAIR